MIVGYVLRAHSSASLMDRLRSGLKFYAQNIKFDP